MIQQICNQHMILGQKVNGDMENLVFSEKFDNFRINFYYYESIALYRAVIEYAGIYYQPEHYELKSCYWNCLLQDIYCETLSKKFFNQFGYQNVLEIRRLIQSLNG